MIIKYFVQRKNGGNYVSYKKPFDTIAEAKQHANELDIGTEPEALRIVDDYGKVMVWVPRNGWKPGGALAPKCKDCQCPCHQGSGWSCDCND